MKKFVIFALMSVMVFALQAQTVSQTEAMQRATEYFNRHVRPAALRSTASAEPSGVTPWMAGDTTCMYAVQMAEGGWVLVSADDRTTSSVLAYSENGTFDTDDMPDGMKWLLGDYARQILRVKQDSTISQKQVGTSALRSTQPQNDGSGSAIYTPGEWLLNLKDEGEILWSQDWYPGRRSAYKAEGDSCSRAYNYFCPKIELRSTKTDCFCNRSPAGCGPVAMGQVMRYWKWPLSAIVPVFQGSDEATVKLYDWDNMPSSISNKTTIEDAQKVSSLLRDLSIAAKTKYGPEESSTSRDNVYETLQLYSYHVVRAEVKSDVGNLLRNEIDEGRPVIFAAWTKDSGHDFVIDGYKDPLGNTNYFHVNWGWGPRDSTSRSYCLLDALCPMEKIIPEKTYSNKKEIFYQIYPQCKVESENTSISGEVTQNFGIQVSDKLVATCVIKTGELFMQVEEVELQPGFEVKSGAVLDVKTPAYQYCQTKGPGKKK